MPSEEPVTAPKEHVRLTFLEVALVEEEGLEGLPEACLVFLLTFSGVTTLASAAGGISFCCRRREERGAPLLLGFSGVARLSARDMAVSNTAAFTVLRFTSTVVRLRNLMALDTIVVGAMVVYSIFCLAREPLLILERLARTVSFEIFRAVVVIIRRCCSLPLACWLIK